MCVVGDSDQNIYSWRGADMSNILNFEKSYPGAMVVILEKNYRSTQTILAAADEVIKKNTVRIAKVLITDNDDGHQIKVYQAFSENDEANFVVEHAARQISMGTRPRDIAILFRTNFQSRALEEAFMGAGIPYHVLGVKFFERKEIKDILAYIRAALNPGSLTDIKRVINYPKRGIGKATIAKIFSGQARSLSATVQKKYQVFQDTLSSIAKFSRKNTVGNTIKHALQVSGIQEYLQQGGEEDMERLANIKELVSYATRYNAMEPEEALQKLLEDASLMGEQDALKTKDGERDAVHLMTIHASKGLEFDHVFITGLEQGLFPSQRDREKREDQEEERRLMYVALTRAKKHLYLSHARLRRIYGEQEVHTPSEFLSDIPEYLIEHLASEDKGWDQHHGGDETVYLDF
jgi:DNA helicase-2/ATP-dependent DNA helicase PcrA